MVDLTRRKTVIGLGLLATGSGATFTSATFQNSTDPASDLRVAVDEELIVEPGSSLRDNDGDYDPSLSDEFYGQDNSDFFSQNASEVTQGSDESLGSDVNLGDLPAAFVSNDQNDDLTIKAVVEVGKSHTFDELIQVRNTGTDSVEVGVKFQQFGVDTTGDQDNNGGAVDEANAIGVYRFNRASDDTQISTDAVHFSNNDIGGVGGQRVDNKITVDSVSTEQIDLEVDTGVNITGPAASQIRDAANINGNPFLGQQDTVQLVNTVRFGKNPDSTT